MADPTNRSDPTYSADPEHYVFVGGRWQRRESKASGEAIPADPHPKVSARTVAPPSDLFDDPRVITDRELGRYGVGNEIANFAGYEGRNPNFQNLAIRAEAANPYNAQMADRARGAQMALIEQMRAQQAGPSLAAMRGQQALGQSGQQALGLSAMNPGLNRGAMLGVRAAGVGVANDTGAARLAEILKSQSSIGGLAGNLRGADISSAGNQSQAGLKAQAIADQRARFYGDLGASLAQKRAQAASDNQRMRDDLVLRVLKNQVKFGTDMSGAGAGAVSTIATSGGKK